MIEGFSDKLKEAWTTHQSWMQTAIEKDPSAQDKGQPDKDAPVGLATKANAKRKIEQNGKTGDDTPNANKAAKPGKGPKGVAKIEVEAMAAAKRLKVSYGTAMAQSKALMSALEHDVTWQAFNIDSMKKPLADAIESVERHMRDNSFAGDVITQDLSKLKKDNETFSVDVRRFNDTMPALINNVQAECEILVNMKQARTSRRMPSPR